MIDQHVGGKPRFRHPDKFPLLPYREFLRRHMPTGSEGFVPEDIDLVIRLHGPRYGTDETGRFMLCELKYDRAPVEFAQRMTFGLIHRLLRQADPERTRYLGYYVIHYSCDDWGQSSFTVNGMPLTRERFFAFLQGDIEGIPDLPWLQEEGN